VFPAGKSKTVLDATGIRDMSRRPFDTIPKQPVNVLALSAQ
jgi:hypothetical protein